MKLLLLPLLPITTAVAAQPLPTPPPAPVQLPSPVPAVWDPAGPYISAGQDEPGYRSWYLAAPWRAARVKSFNDYLDSADVGGVLPTWQLLRTATSWSECGGQPFEVPPSSEWPHIVQTLRYVRDYVVPAIGPVEAVSVYRNPVLNKCAGGAPQSAHKLDSAIDMVPLRPTTREAMMKTLCGIHTEHGAAYSAGLGFYAYLRFHVDSTKFRRWNMDPAVAADCPPIIHPEDIASVGQPLPPAATTTPLATPTAASTSTLPPVSAKPTETNAQTPATPPQGGVPHSQP
ncbi:MAG TPA: D-Ala-D-Ala carboxypeptidase family metallohydrolase [Sphingomicrobium sp.]|nr:D-Ala-D-Ala carboxypeptidase family metallohydrolase [Sphingomicrobium sp.]